MEWAAAWQACGPDATEAEVTAAHIGEPLGTSCTERDMILVRLHWLRLARVPTLALVRSILPQCPTAALARHYPPTVPPAPTVPPGWTTEVVLAGLPGPGVLELLWEVPLVRKVHVVSPAPLAITHRKLQWHRPTVAPGSLGLELALCPHPAHVSMLLLDPQRLYHPLLMTLMMRASQVHGRQALLSTTEPPSLAGGLFFWPSALGSGRRWSRLLSQTAELSPSFLITEWRGPVRQALEPALLPSCLVSRTLAWQDGHADPVPLPPELRDAVPELPLQPELPSADVTPEQVLLAMRLAFPFCRQVWVEAGWSPAAQVFGVDAVVTAVPPHEPGAVLVAHRRPHPDWSGHQLVLGQDAAAVQLGPIGIHVNEAAAPLRLTLLQGVCRQAPEWKWRGWLYPHRLEGWLRLCPLMRASGATTLAALGPVRHDYGPQELPLLEELAQSLPGLTLERQATAASRFLYAPTWALLPPHHGATWVLVDEPPHDQIPSRLIHMARGQQTLLGPALLPLEPLAAEWCAQGDMTAATLRCLSAAARTAPASVGAVVPLPVHHADSDRWLDERVHGEQHGGLVEDDVSSWSVGLFRQRGEAVLVCPAA